MAVCDVQFYSKSLEKSCPLTVVVPRRHRRPYAVLYLLHGLGGDHRSWLPFGIEERLARTNILAVLPDGQRGYFANAGRLPGGSDWEDLICKDVVGFIDSTFRTRPEPQARMIAGLSMGGYGALLMALKHPDLFSAAYSTSGAVYFAAMDHPNHSPFPTGLMRALPAEECNLFTLAEKAKAAGARPQLRFDCGTEDYLLGPNRALREHLVALGVEHQYDEYPGAHDDDYWTARVPQMVDMAKDVLTA